MPDVRHMDTSLNRVLRNQVAQEAIDLVLRFCQAAKHRHALKRLEEPFTDNLRSYVASALLENGRAARGYRREILDLIQKAGDVTRQKQSVE